MEHEEQKYIFTHEEAGELIGLFEDILIRHRLFVPSPEDDKIGRKCDKDVGLYGSVYADLFDEVEVRLIRMLDEKEKGAEVIRYVYRG